MVFGGNQGKLPEGDDTLARVEGKGERFDRQRGRQRISEGGHHRGKRNKTASLSHRE